MQALPARPVLYFFKNNRLQQGAGGRLEDDVTRSELLAVVGVVLAAVGLWYDDFVPGGSPVTPQLVNVLIYSTGLEKNDKPFKAEFSYVATSWSGTETGN